MEGKSKGSKKCVMLIGCASIYVSQFSLVCFFFIDYYLKKKLNATFILTYISNTHTKIITCTELPEQK